MGFEVLSVSLAVADGDTPFEDAVAIVHSDEDGDPIAAIRLAGENLTIQTGGLTAAQDLIDGLHGLAEKVRVAHETWAAGEDRADG